jgi:uncharacterized membrane protein YhhN
MTHVLLLLALPAALADWVAVSSRRKRLEYAAKPAVMLLLTAWFVLNGGWQGWTAWFVAGALCSLAGDVFLMLRRERFMAGLACFLLAHLAYILGFNPTLPPPHPLTLLMGLGLAVGGGFLVRGIWRALQKRGLARLRVPVLVYALVLGLMCLSALATHTRPAWQGLPAWSASLGALLFALSDSLLATNKFARRLPGGRLATHLTYHLGQAFILLSALLAA